MEKTSLYKHDDYNGTASPSVEGDQESLLSSYHVDEISREKDHKQPRTMRRLRIANWLLIIIFMVSLSFNTFFVMKWNAANLDKLCYKHTSAFPSPMDKDIEPHYTLHDVNGSLAKQTIYRMPGSPEVDAAWDALGAHLLPFAIPEDEGLSYGLHPGQVKRIPEQGGGYVAILESTHHLHCLNVMRQASHWDYDYYRAEGLRVGNSVFSGPEDMVKLHFSHCMDMLRQRLMCDADPAPLGQVWVKDFGPLVFDTVQRKCRDFDQLLKWARDHQLPAGMKSVRVREGDLVYPEWP